MKLLRNMLKLGLQQPVWYQILRLGGARLEAHMHQGLYLGFRVSVAAAAAAAQ